MNEQVDMKNKILDFLYDKNLVNKKTNTVNYYWDYSEKISANETLRILKEDRYIKTFEDLKDRVEEELSYLNEDTVDYYIDDLTNSIINNFSKNELIEYFNCDGEELKGELREFIYDNDIYFSWNINKENIEEIPFQIALSNEKYLEDDWYQLTPFQQGYDSHTKGEFNMNNLEEMTKEELLNIKEEIEYKDNNMLGILVQSQGYELKDLYDDKKVEKSKFLKSLKEEICNYDTELSGMSIIFSGKTNIENYFNSIIDNRALNIVFPKETTLGFANIIQGGGCSMNIELEKDAIIPMKNILNIEYGNNYDVDKIFNYYLKEVQLDSNNEITNYKETDFKNLIDEIADLKFKEKNKWDLKKDKEEMER